MCMLSIMQKSLHSAGDKGRMKAVVLDASSEMTFRLLLDPQVDAVVLLVWSSGNLFAPST